jgi:hypothetical protein
MTELTQEELIDFTQRIRKDTLFEAISVLQNVPNPQVNQAAINKILNYIEVEFN